VKAASAEIWRSLFAHALDLIDSVSAGGGEFVEWTFGGGTALMLRHRHRVSRDIDIFIADPQYLTWLSPRLNDVALSKTTRYLEQGNSLRFQFPAGEVDFIVAPPLTKEDYELTELLNRPVRLETSAEIVAKKVWYRGAALKARDLFDIALVVDREPQRLEAAKSYLLERRAAILERLEQQEDQLRDDFAGLQALDYRPTYDHCVASVRNFLQALHRQK